MFLRPNPLLKHEIPFLLSYQRGSSINSLFHHHIFPLCSIILIIKQTCHNFSHLKTWPHVFLELPYHFSITFYNKSPPKSCLFSTVSGSFLYILFWTHSCHNFCPNHPTEMFLIKVTNSLHIAKSNDQWAVFILLYYLIKLIIPLSVLFSLNL